MTPPLSGPDRQILDLLVAGRSFDEVCEVGRYRRSFKPSDVHRVVSTLLPARVPPKLRDNFPPALEKHRHQRKHKPIEHGKPGSAGYRAHFREGTEPCDACRDARNADDWERKHQRKSA